MRSLLRSNCRALRDEKLFYEIEKKDVGAGLSRDG